MGSSRYLGPKAFISGGGFRMARFPLTCPLNNGIFALSLYYTSEVRRNKSNLLDIFTNVKRR